MIQKLSGGSRAITTGPRSVSGTVEGVLKPFQVQFRRNFNRFRDVPRIFTGSFQAVSDALENLRACWWFHRVAAVFREASENIQRF